MESLLAAFRATEDNVFLREAVETYPEDPRVNFVAYFAASNQPDLGSEERRQSGFYDRVKISGERAALR